MRSDCSFVRAANGLRFAYVEQGERDGPAVLLLHGYTDSHRSFDLLRPHLPESWRVIALTQRGHGKSDKPNAGYSVGDMAADVDAFLDALGIERAVIVGHSMGAAVALQTAADFPARVGGLALIGGFASYQDNANVEELAQEVAKFNGKIDPEFVLAFQESTIADMIPQSFLDVVVAESMRCPTHVWRAALDGQLAAEPVATARRCRAPAALIRGDWDAFVPHGDQLALRDAMASARIFTVRSTGHSPQWERPEEVAGVLRAFVGEIADAGALLRSAVFS
ncbi:MAG TPA: alpha/beta hydrolase [Vitreimonas sp.]|uniref:alpha/beta fold hydrolase n=1 Tax=Vitreimonas sp. TaxID=3069702 RepID=UPI002D6CD3ED|nr:alpha/beta hydrolase [Vitreimonas sp.]HYD87069.1 alpha/beta hydrolase [Vitreimonas sp.]